MILPRPGFAPAYDDACAARREVERRFEAHLAEVKREHFERGAHGIKARPPVVARIVAPISSSAVGISLCWSISSVQLSGVR